MKPRSYALSQKIITILFFILISFHANNIKSVCATTSTRKFVDGCHDTRIVCLIKKIGESLNEIRQSAGELITSSTTISNSGVYFLGQDVDCPIIIDSDDVYLDLNGYSVYGTCTGIIVNENKKNILIKNGSLNGAVDCVFECAEENLNNASGVLIKEGAMLVQIEDLNIFGYTTGLYFNGTASNKIKSCDVTDTTLSCNNNGVVLNYTRESTFVNCEALSSFEVGYKLFKCKRNIFYQCKSLETENDTDTKSASGFLSTSGTGNLFIECVVNASTKNTKFGYNANGFLFNGTATEYGEFRSEIVNCVVNKSQTTGDSNAYGIHFDSILKTTPLSNVVTTTIGPDQANVVDWSTDCDFIAVGYNYASEKDRIRIFTLDNSTLRCFAQKTPATNNENVNDLAWSPRGKYLAVGTDQNYSGNEFYLYKFDPDDVVNEFFTELAAKNMGKSVNSLAWHHEGRYLAIGTSYNSTYEIEVWGFENETLGSSEIAKKSVTGSILDIAFSPDGNYIAAITANKLYIYEFNPLSDANSYFLIQKVAQTSFDIGYLKSVDWSPIACGSKYFLAVSGEDSSNKNIQIFSYDGNTTLTSFESAYSLSTTAHISEIKWSPNGRYVLTTGFNATEEVEIFQFDASASSGSRLSSKDTANYSTVQSYSAKWSPSGKYVISVGASTTDNLIIYKVSNVPTKCVIKGCEIMNCEGGLCGIGIEGASCRNLIIRNVGYENGINFSYGVYNTFYGGLNGSPSNIDNVSFPPYQD